MSVSGGQNGANNNALYFVYRLEMARFVNHVEMIMK